MKIQGRFQFRWWLAVVATVGMLLPTSSTMATSPSETIRQLNCTFTAKYPVILLRSGPGQDYAMVGFLRAGDTLNVIDQTSGKDGYVWWQDANESWVRSDLGTSDCPSTCGNSVCEYGETASSCASDCGTPSRTLQSTGTGCNVANSQECYESIACYPDCNNCRCWLNDYGCVTCYCDYPSSTDVSATFTSLTGCQYASCEACIAAYPCSRGPCSQTECHLNEYGCPVCQTAP